MRKTKLIYSKKIGDLDKDINNYISESGNSLIDIKILKVEESFNDPVAVLLIVED